ncbi:MAG: FAD-dependent oxidoreductase [Bacteroidetes bacterium]|nr:FAD-dependent oxidoreductase [Bacteroidota bacterium]
MKKIVVIGCGVAGMSATMYAIKNGYNVDIYEKNNYIGGRCFSFFDEKKYNTLKKICGKNVDKNLFYLDNGQHLISGAYTYFFELLDWIGTKSLIINKNKLKVNFIDTEFDRKYIVDFKNIFKLLSTKYITAKDKINLIYFFIYLLKNENKLAKHTILDVCKKTKLNDFCIEKIISPIVVSIMNSAINIAPASLFANTIKIILSDRKNGLILTYCKKNFADLFAPFISKINENCNLFLNTKVTDFFVENNICKGIILSDGSVHLADKVIATIPPNDYSKIKKTCENSQHFLNSAILSAYIWTGENLNLNHEYNAIIGTYIDWIFDMNAQNNDEKTLYQYRITTSNFNKFNNKISENFKEIAGNIKEIIEAELEIIFKKKIKLYAIHIINQPAATPLITMQNNKLRPNSKTSIQNLYIAGDWTNTGLPACIESAAMSGYLAVKELK